MECSCCKKKFDVLICKSKYNGNKDDNYYCESCFKKVHKEKYVTTKTP